MRAIVILFLVVFGLNLVPAFAPPTWMVFSYIGFRYVAVNVTLLALVGALAATLGRMALAKMARMVIRQRFLSDNHSFARKRWFVSVRVRSHQTESH